MLDRDGGQRTGAACLPLLAHADDALLLLRVHPVVALAVVLVGAAPAGARRATVALLDEGLDGAVLVVDGHAARLADALVDRARVEEVGHVGDS